MLVKIKFDAPLIEIARMAGCAPCQILAVNKVRREDELVMGSYIMVPVVTRNLVI